MKFITFFVVTIFSIAPCFQLLPMMKDEQVVKEQYRFRQKLAEIQQNFEIIKWQLLSMRTNGVHLSKKEMIGMELDIGIILNQVISFDKMPKKPYS